MTPWFIVSGPVYYTAKLYLWTLGWCAAGILVKKLWRRLR